MSDQFGKGYFDENDHKKSLRVMGLTGVFGLMFIGLLASAFSAFFTLSSPFMWNLVFGSEF
ncbi:MAG: hypothetical protein FWD84_04775, partial [Oscillospiraceae bacterium]|nr:hypothetical protein [Oscillospiraceae bacterium]